MSCETINATSLLLSTYSLSIAAYKTFAMTFFSINDFGYALKETSRLSMYVGMQSTDTEQY